MRDAQELGHDGDRLLWRRSGACHRHGPHREIKPVEVRRMVWYYNVVLGLYFIVLLYTLTFASSPRVVLLLVCVIHAISFAMQRGLIGAGWWTPG